ncbi:MAG: hypothetical protein ACRDJX_04920 [Solirubrobacteraceae bacterium]
MSWLAQSLSGLTGNRSLDRLIRSRTWIALIAFALIGIVTLQLLVLRLNADIGHALVRQSVLQRENAALSIESSELAAGERVESEAARLDMELVPEGSLRFLGSDPSSDIARAAAALKAPVRSSSTTSSRSAATATSGGESSEASSPEAPAPPSAGSSSEQVPAAAQESAAGASATGTGVAETPPGTEVPAGETAPSTASATATGAAEAAVGGVGASQATPAD